MRYVRCVIIPGDEGFHPIDRQLQQEDHVTGTQLHNINLLDDGTGVVLFEFAGDTGRIREVASASDEVYEFQVSEGADRVTVYAHFEPSETVRELLELIQHHEVILDLPLEYTDRGGVRALLVGSEDTIRSLIPKVPDGVRLKLEQTGDYAPETTRLYSTLTDRQKETLKVALEAGYYENPKQATQKDVADRLGRSDGTVGEHLRKIEKKILAAVAP